MSKRLPTPFLPGDLNALKDAVDNLQFAQDWALDATGNWRNFREDDDGDSTWDLNQQRTANKVNEISDISETTGPTWITPVYNRAGNMTTIPKPAGLTTSFTATYDAWNRAVKIEEGPDKVAEYEYDGAKRRAVKKTYASGSLDETRHFYYTEPAKWQVVEERVDSSSDPDRQFVWGLRYVDDIIVRDRDTTGDGTLEERLYGIQDANWHLTSIADTNGLVQERFAYAAYGVSAARTAAFSSRASSNYDWEVRFAGYRWDLEGDLYQVRNRVLHPALGVWIQRDPLGFASGANLYQYANSSPANLTDPTGRGPVILVIAGIGFTLADICLIVLGIALVVCLATPGCPAALFDLVHSIARGVGAAFRRIVEWIRERCRRRVASCDKCAETVKHLWYEREETCEILTQTWEPPCICRYGCKDSGEVIDLPGIPIFV